MMYQFFGAVVFACLKYTIREKRTQRVKNRIIWIHLSAWITASQGYLGMADPGKQSSITVKINQAIAGRKCFTNTGLKLVGKNTAISSLCLQHTSGQG